MWDKAREDMEYQKMTKLIETKVPMKEMIDRKAAKEYVGNRIRRKSVINKGKTLIMLKDETRILMPEAMSPSLLERENLSHSKMNKMRDSMMVKCYWTSMGKDVKRTWRRALCARSIEPSRRGTPSGPPLSMWIAQ